MKFTAACLLVTMAWTMSMAAAQPVTHLQQVRAETEGHVRGRMQDLKKGRTVTFIVPRSKGVKASELPAVHGSPGLFPAPPEPIPEPRFVTKLGKTARKLQGLVPHGRLTVGKTRVKVEGGWSPTGPSLLFTAPF